MPSRTCPANLSDYWKQFSLPAIQCQHTCNMARNRLQAGHAITPLIGLSGFGPSLIGYPCDILGWLIHGHIPSQLPHFQNFNIGWLNNGNVFHEGVGYKPRLLLSMRKSLIECIHKGDGHTRYDLQYINL